MISTAAWQLWGNARAELRAELDRTRFAQRARARNRLMVMELVAKRFVLEEGKPSTLPAELLEEYATERWGEEAPGRDASTFRRAIADLENAGWLEVQRQEPRWTPTGWKRPALVLRAGRRLQRLLGAVSRVFRGLSRSVISAVADRLDLARRSITRQAWSTPFSSPGVRTRVPEGSFPELDRFKAWASSKGSPPSD